MSKCLHTLILLLLTAVCAFAQSLEVQVSTDRVAQGETFLISYTYTSGISDLQLPDLKGFDVYGQGKTSNVSIVGSKVTRSTTLTLTMRALSPGAYKIKPATAKYEGKTIRSAGFTIFVEGSGAGAADPQQEDESPAYIDKPRGSWKDNIVLIAEADKSKVYAGEQLTVTYTLYRKLDYRSMEVNQIPVYKGFLSEEMEVPEGDMEGVRTFRGSKFYYQTFRRVALFPTQSGKFTIDPLSLRGVIMVPDESSFFGGIFNVTQPKAIELLSNRLEVEVLPLPSEGRPANFSGAVGHYSAERKFPKTTVNAGQTLPMEITVSGKGNLRAVSMPQPLLPGDIEYFDPEVEDAFQKAGKYFGGLRTFRYALVPVNSGKVVLPGMEFNWFNPTAGKYEKAVFVPQEIEVLPSTSAAASAQRRDSGTFNPAIHGQWLKANPPQIWPSAVMLGVPALAFALLLFFYFKQKSSEIQISVKAAAPLKFSEPAAKEDYRHLANWLRGALANHYQLPADVTDEALLTALQDPFKREQIGYILAACDRAAYSPLQAESPAQLMAQAEQILGSLPHSNSTTA